eukprot:6174615-Pleurochrysis_carterae.AAC.4
MPSCVCEELTGSGHTDRGGMDGKKERQVVDKDSCRAVCALVRICVRRLTGVDERSVLQRVGVRVPVLVVGDDGRLVAIDAREEAGRREPERLGAEAQPQRLARPRDQLARAENARALCL